MARISGRLSNYKESKLSRQRDTSDQPPGEESFLDVVANLVGILVILIMVVGMRARGAWETASRAEMLSQQAQTATTTDSTHDESLEIQRQVDEQVQRRAALQSATLQSQADLERLRTETALRELERDKLHVMLAQLEHAIAEERADWDRTAQQQAQLQDQLHANEQQRAKLRLQLDDVAKLTAETVILDHVPTPMAQTVFGSEEHFRLQGGRLVYVPLNILVDNLKDDARRRLGELRTRENVTATIGPYGGFQLRYNLARRVVEVDTRIGTQSHEMAQLTDFELVPQSDDLGAPLAEQMRPGSALHGQLAQWNPHKTVITVWTYPDSFAEFRELKVYLEKQGFLAAARPLPDGQWISGSPNGSHSAAQ